MQSASMVNSTKLLSLLSRLVLRRTPTRETPAEMPPLAEQLPEAGNLQPDERSDLLALAHSHHVIVRTLRPFRHLMAAARRYDWAEWAATEVENEQGRIDTALDFLQRICVALEANGCDVTVIKSLDHWPDLGSDLDLYTNGDAVDVVRTMTRDFRARLAPRSWGDRLANKWSFVVPGLREAVEVHVGRLGQTGEQVALGHTLTESAVFARVGGYALRVPAPEDRLLIATLQRMYRHFYLRLCEIANTAQLLDAGVVDYTALRVCAESAGVWPGLATYLSIVDDYVRRYRGVGLRLPAFIQAAAQFGGDQISFAKGFLRIPIVPHSVGLYASELTSFVRKGDLQAALRLGLLPGLATVAALEMFTTGNDKGIW
jgi:hypothetical protein